jgi:hypothetical protein
MERDRLGMSMRHLKTHSSIPSWKDSRTAMETEELIFVFGIDFCSFMLRSTELAFDSNFN